MLQVQGPVKHCLLLLLMTGNNQNAVLLKSSQPLQQLLRQLWLQAGKGFVE